MRIAKNVVSGEIAKKLKIAKWVRRTEFIYVEGYEKVKVIKLMLITELVEYVKTTAEWWSAPIISELLEELPANIATSYLTIKKNDEENYVALYVNEDGSIKNSPEFVSANLADALALLWIYVQEYWFKLYGDAK